MLCTPIAMEPNTVHVYRLCVRIMESNKGRRSAAQKMQGSGMRNHTRAGHSQAVTGFAVVGVHTLGF